MTVVEKFKSSRFSLFCILPSRLRSSFSKLPSKLWLSVMLLSFIKTTYKERQNKIRVRPTLFSPVECSQRLGLPCSTSRPKAKNIRPKLLRRTFLLKSIKESRLAPRRRLIWLTICSILATTITFFARSHLTSFRSIS